jgi:hypothetical protein
MSADSALLDAARHERDRRLAAAPEAIEKARNDARSGGRGTAEDVIERVAISCQCWIAIAEWIETGRFAGFYGGASPQEPDAPWISWPELEAAAERALANVAAQCDRLFEGGDVPAYEAACARRSGLWAIHRKVQRMRESIDMLNAEFRASRANQHQREGISA